MGARGRSAASLERILKATADLEDNFAALAGRKQMT
jgi:hypothetical protein